MKLILIILDCIFFCFFGLFYVKTLQEINLSLQNSCSSNPCPQNVTCLNGFTESDTLASRVKLVTWDKIVEKIGKNSDILL